MVAYKIALLSVVKLGIYLMSYLSHEHGHRHIPNTHQEISPEIFSTKHTAKKEQITLTNPYS